MLRARRDFCDAGLVILCHACHRHFRAQDSACPFCGAGLRTTTGPSLRGLMGAAALAIGLTLSGCDDEEEGESTTGETAGDTTGGDTTGETGESGTTETTTDSGGADYGGAPAPDPEHDI